MVSAAQIADYRAGTAQLVDYFNGDLRTIWKTLDLRSPSKARDLLLGAVPELTDIYGEYSAVIAAEWYDELRSLEGVPGEFTARLADTVPAEVVQARTKYGARHLWSPDPEQMLVFLENALHEYILQPGRDTISRASIDDPYAVGWQRQTRPTESYAHGCRFCQMLAGRGGVYRKPTANFAAHGNCNCVAVPSWDPSAKEVPAMVYEASKTTSKMSEAQREAHNREIRSYLDEHFPVSTD